MSPKAKPGGVIPADLAAKAAEVLGSLTPAEEKVLRMKFGVGASEAGATSEEVGQDFEVTRQRIREIEAKALAKLRSPNRSARLKAFTDEEENDD